MINLCMGRVYVAVFMLLMFVCADVCMCVVVYVCVVGRGGCVYLGVLCVCSCRQVCICVYSNSSTKNMSPRMIP